MDAPRDEWDFYYTQRNNSDASILVNLGLRFHRPDPQRPYKLSVRLQLRAPTPRGMNTADERPILDRIDDALRTVISIKCDATFVGRVISSGFWYFVYYAPTRSYFKEVVAEVMENYSEYQYSLSTHEERDWSTYFGGLVPTEREFQQIVDRRVVENLKRHCDPLTASREVNHWIYFSNAFDRSQFVEDLRDGNFDFMESELPDDGKRTRRFCVQLSRDDYVDYASIHKLVLALFDGAAQRNGEYDGWETVIMKPTTL